MQSLNFFSRRRLGNGLCSLLSALGMLVLASCQVAPSNTPQGRGSGATASGAGMSGSVYLPPAPAPQEGLLVYGDTVPAFRANPTFKVSEKPVSVFAADVDTAAYSYVRRRLNQGYLPERSAVRLEELVNYFAYQYPQPPSARQPFAVTPVVHASPWSQGRKLIHLGIQGYRLAHKQVPPANLVFLLDVSISMQAPERLPLVKQSVEMLLSKLRPSDTVAIVTYGEEAGVVLPPTAVAQKTRILQSLRTLRVQRGAAASARGLPLAYELAEAHYKAGGVNRIVLATDGDFNLAPLGDSQLEALVAQRRERGVYLSVLGVGQGDYRDATMQRLARAGNGIAAYIDTLGEAQKVLIHEARASLFPIADSLKIHVEFNPSRVAEYRLLGYETRWLRREDFNNSKVASSHIGSGHAVTAIYEVALVGSGGEAISPLRYSARPPQQEEGGSSPEHRELAFVTLRYNLPGSAKLKTVQVPVFDHSPARTPALARDVKFATAVAGFAQLLQGGESLQQWSYDHVIALALRNRGDDPYGYRNEFVQLARKAKIAKPLVD